jgi:hypothetical protein
VSGASVVWADSSGETEETDDPAGETAGGELDESIAARRLRRWLKGMFGGRPAEEDEPPPPGSSK